MTDITVADIRALRPDLAPFAVPGWGGTVYIRKLPLSLRLKLYEEFDGDSGRITGDTIISLIVACVADSEGVPLFTIDDTEWLDAEFADEVQEVFAKISEVAGWSAEALEEAEGN